MRKFVLVVAVLALAVGIGLPAGAAPDNKNTTFILSLDCDNDETVDVTVRAQPGNGLPAWDVETGENWVAKWVAVDFTLQAEVLEGGTYGPVSLFTAEKDYGAKAPAKGRTTLRTCEGSVVDEGVIESLTAEEASDYDTLFGTTDFEQGQTVRITAETHFDLKVFAPGR